MNFKLSWGPWSWDRIISTEEIIHLYAYHGEGRPDVCGAEECPLTKAKKASVEFKVTEKVIVGDKRDLQSNPEAVKQLQFNPPLTIPIEDAEGNTHIFEGCYVKSVEYNYPADGPVVVEEVDPLHPDGKCTCAGEGTCDWCRTHCIHCGSKTEEARVRENIAAYLRHVASVEVGTILTPAGREIVGWCASWVENRLDEKWLKDKLVELPQPIHGSALVIPPNSEVGRLHTVREGGVETRKLRYAGNGRWQVTPVSCALWHGQGGSIQSWKRDDEG